MKAGLITLFGAYTLLMALLAVEFFATAIPFHGLSRLLLLIPALLMVGVVMTAFMDIERAGSPAIMFAVSAALWLSMLLGLGLLDPLTRVMFPASHGITRHSR